MMSLRHWSAGPARVAGLLVLLGLFSTATAQAESSATKPPVETLVDQLAGQAKGNPYLEDRIKSILQQLTQELKEGQLRTKLLNTTPQELLRGIQNTTQGDYILAVDYGIDWEGLDYTPYLKANLDAASRGVQITRTFIISGKAPKRGLCQVMKRMQESGIKVRVAKKDHLAGHREYDESKAARVIFHYRNKYAVLMIEAIPLPDLKLGDPYVVDVTWEPRKIEDSIHYFDWLMAGKQSQPFDPKTCGL